MTRILVTGAGGSAAYNFVDALRQSDEELYIVGCDMKPEHLELMDIDAKYLVPGVKDPAYVEKMNAIIEKEKIDFVHPQPDVEVGFLSEHASKLHAKTFLPTKEAVAACHDKMQFNTILSEKGVAVPRAFHITNKDSLAEAIKELSPNKEKVWLRAIRGAGSRGSLPVNDIYHADGWIDYWRTFKGLDYPDFMASEFLPGAEFAWQSLWLNGELITSQARERIEYIFGNLTPSGQTSSPSVAKTTNRKDVNEAGEAAVRAVVDKPHGVFCVDMKEDANGAPKVTEINPGRFFTTSNFFAHAGLNMPAMYLTLGMGGELAEKPPKYDALPDDLYWVRMIDMGFKLVKGGEWSSQKI
jgi:glutathione synthase/RimK-type ligase-like ATP-grasp enzyme